MPSKTRSAGTAGIQRTTNELLATSEKLAGLLGKLERKNPSHFQLHTEQQGSACPRSVLSKMFPEMQAFLALREQLELMEASQCVGARFNFDPTNRQSHFVGEISHDCIQSQAIRRRGVNLLDRSKHESMISLARPVYV